MVKTQEFLKLFDRVCEAPDAVGRLRKFVLDLAVRGKLVEQDANDEPVERLLRRIENHRALLATEGKPRDAITITPLRADDGPFAVPSTWAWVHFGEVMISRDSERIPVSKDERSGRAKTYDYYGASGVIDKIDKYLFDKPLLLIGEDGANLVSRSTPIAFIARGKYWVNNHAHVLDGISEEFLEFIELHINAIDLKPYVTGTAQPKMNQAKMNSIPIALPPLPEQHRIVAKVNELMSLCDQLEAAQKDREARRDALSAASLQRLNNPDPDARAFRAHARFHLSILPRVTARPEQVKLLRQTILNLAARGKLSTGSDLPAEPKPLGEFATLQNGYAFKSEWFSRNGIRLLRNVNVSHGFACWDDTVCLPKERADEFERFLLAEGDIVLSLDRPFIATGIKVARIGPSDLPCLLLQRVGRFEFKATRLTTEYLFLWLHSPHFTDQIDPGRSNGVPHVSSRQVEAAQIMVPPIPEQHRIVAKVNGLLALCDQLESQLTVSQSDMSNLLESLLHEPLDTAEAA